MIRAFRCALIGFLLVMPLSSSVVLAQAKKAEQVHDEKAELSHDEAGDKSADSHAGDEQGDDHTGPPLKPGPDLVVWTIITFGVFLFALKKLAWGPLIEGLDNRESSARQAAAETQHALEKSQVLLKQHEEKLQGAQDEVREIIAEAKRDAERTSADIIAKAQAEAEASRSRAVEDIGRAKDAALSELFDSMSGQVAGATEHVLGRALNDGDQERLIDDALSQFSRN